MSINRMFIGLLITQMFLVNVVSAQTEQIGTSTAEELTRLGLPVALNNATGELRCDEYIHTPIESSIVTDSASVLAGAALNFSIQVANKTDRPFTDVRVHLLIIKQDGVSAGTIAEYVTLQEGKALSGKEVQDFSYTWSVPNNIAPGVYYPVLYVADGDTALLGNSLSGHAASAQQRFEIADGETSTVFFDTKKSLLNETSFFHGGLSYIDETKKNSVSLVLSNTTTVAKTIPLQWNQYSGAVTDDVNRKYTKTELVTIDAGETRVVTYDVQSQAESMVIVTATISDGQAKSILGFPLLKNGGNEVIVRASGLSVAPEMGKEVMMFACVEATSVYKISNAMVTLSLKDETGTVVEEHTYTGDINGVATGVGKAFTLVKNYQALTLTTTISIDNVVVRENSQTYSCENLGGTCFNDAAKDSIFDVLMSYKYVFLGFLSALLLLVVYMYRKKEPVVVAMVCFGLMALSIFPLTTEAKTAVWTGDIPHPIWANNYPIETTVNYFSTVRNVSQGNMSLSDGAAISVGDQLRVEIGPFTNADIRWTPKGSALEPGVRTFIPGFYRSGHFTSAPLSPSNHCSVEDISTYMSFDMPSIAPLFDVNWYLSGGANVPSTPSSFFSTFWANPVAVNPPTYTINTTGLSCSGVNCTVTSPGNVSVQILFAPTTASVYSFLSSDPSSFLCFDGDGRIQNHTIPQQNINFNFSASPAVPTNIPPNPPTITGPITGNPNVSHSFTFNATDGNNDQIYYQVDWNNDGVPDQRLPSSGLVQSGTGLSAQYSWATDGAKTFQARTVDSAGNVSATWTQYTITLSTPAAVADLKINGSDSPITVNQGSSMTIAWSSSNAASCTLYGANLPAGGGVVAPSGSTNVIANNSDTYVLTCGTANDSVFVTVVNMAPTTATLEAQINDGAWSTSDQTVNPNDTVRLQWSSYNANTCSDLGSGFNTGNNTAGRYTVTTPAAHTNKTFTVSCTGPSTTDTDSLTITTRQLPNFTTPLITFNPLTFNTTTGTYDSLEVIFQTSNNGGSNTTPSANYQFQFDRGANGYDVTTNGSLGFLNVSASVNRTETVTNVPLGNSRMQVTVDSSNVVSELYEGDNVATLNINIPPPNPGLNITANRTQVKSGETVTLTWTAALAYPLNCRVFGPGVNQNPSGTNGTQQTLAITAKSEFTLSCTEPVTGTVFIDSVTVEAQGKLEEI